jgi:HK97 family phage portal protein
MGILDFFRKSKNPADTLGEQGRAVLESAIQAYHSPKRGVQGLLQSYSSLPWIHAAAGRIAQDNAAVTWTMYRRPHGDGKERRKSGPISRQMTRGDLRSRRKSIQAALLRNDLIEVADHHFLQLFDQMNPVMSGYDGMFVVNLLLDLPGEAFCVVERDERGLPSALYPIPPHWVQAVPTVLEPVYKITFPKQYMELPQSEVLWIKNPDPLHMYGRGTGPGYALADELETDEFAAKHTAAWFKNRAVPELLIGVEGATQEQLERAKAKWEQSHRGIFQSFQTHWYSGALSVNQLSQSFQDQQLIELRRFERDTVFQTYGIPPEIMGVLENANRSTIDAADYHYTKRVQTPRLERQRSALQVFVDRNYGPGYIVDYYSPIPEDNEFILKVATQAPQSRTVNEWREMQGLPPVDGGDVPYVPVTYTSSVGEEASDDEPAA